MVRDHYSQTSDVNIPLIRANPPRLSRMQPALAALEASGIFSNNGALVRRFEAEATERLFGGAGACVTVSNATLGLILACRLAADRGPAGRLALMPSFTFAAAAQAALWAGLTPMLCDIDPDSWVLSDQAVERALQAHGNRVGLVMPYATFGTCIDLERYDWLSRRYEVDVVVDAASSLGSRDAQGRGFGTGSRLTCVYSMHATKTFATAEGGLMYSTDAARMETLRSMANYGFAAGRSASMPGLNAKMSEVIALLALAKLRDIDAAVERRAALAVRYRQTLRGFGFQTSLGQVQAMAFMPVLLPSHLAARRQGIVDALAARGIGAGMYFSPHLAEQPYFRDNCEIGRLPVTRDIAARTLVLPLADDMLEEEVDVVCDALQDLCFPSPRRAQAATDIPMTALA
jgi:dTDP-4-amino-4,6-dideoxygalactose transaminase